MKKVSNSDVVGYSIETIETRSCIASTQIDGIAVVGSDGHKIGHIENLMINKRTWSVEYAIVSDKGFLGLGAFQYLRVDLSHLVYDEALGGFVSDISVEAFKNNGRESVTDAEMQLW